MALCFQELGYVLFVKCMCRVGEDCESKVALREILVLDDIFF